MNKYLKTGEIILELPLLLVIVILVLISCGVVLFFFYDMIREKPASIRLLVPFFGSLLLLVLATGFYMIQDSMGLRHIISPLRENDVRKAPKALSEKEQRINRRYRISEILEKPGFVKDVYDDGHSTFFLLNSSNIPMLYRLNEKGDLKLQAERIKPVIIPGRLFPALKADDLSPLWYLQFNDLIGYIKQNPAFKVSLEKGYVSAFFSDTLVSRIEIQKDRFICDQASSQLKTVPVPHARYFFMFEGIRYYISDCFIDKTENYQVDITLP